MFVQVGHLALRLKSHQSRGVSVAQGPTHSDETIVMSRWCVSHLGAPLAPYMIAHWIDTSHVEGQPVQLWSWYQLYLDIQFCHPNTCPWYKKRLLKHGKMAKIARGCLQEKVPMVHELCHTHLETLESRATSATLQANL